MAAVDALHVAIENAVALYATHASVGAACVRNGAAPATGHVDALYNVTVTAPAAGA
jgi:hypothetical protein